MYLDTLDILNEATVTLPGWDTCTQIYDSLYPKYYEQMKNISNFNKVRSIMVKIFDKNSEVLNDNDVGKPILINDKDTLDLVESLGVPFDVVQEEYFKSTYAQTIPMDKDKGFASKTSGRNGQHLFSIPFILSAAALYRLGKKEQSKFIFAIPFYRAYSSAVTSQFLKYPWNETNHRLMKGIVEKSPEFTLRFGLKKNGTVIATIISSTDSTYDTYIPKIVKGVTDKYICNDLIYSGIYTHTKSWIKGIASIFFKIKASPNWKDYLLDFDKDYSVTTDGNDDVYDVDNGSITSFKSNLIRQAIVNISAEPINDELVKLAVIDAYYKPEKNESQLDNKLSLSSLDMRYGPKSTYFNIVKPAIKEIIDGCRKDLPDYFAAILDSFFLNLDKDGNKRMPADVRSVKFITGSKIIFKSPNSKDKNMLKVREQTGEFLNALSSYYQTHENEGTRQKIKTAVFMYFVLFLREVARS